MLSLLPYPPMNEVDQGQWTEWISPSTDLTRDKHFFRRQNSSTNYACDGIDFLCYSALNSLYQLYNGSLISLCRYQNIYYQVRKIGLLTCLRGCVWGRRERRRWGWRRCPRWPERWSGGGTLHSTPVQQYGYVPDLKYRWQVWRTSICFAIIGPIISPRRVILYSVADLALAPGLLSAECGDSEYFLQLHKWRV